MHQPIFGPILFSNSHVAAAVSPPTTPMTKTEISELKTRRHISPAAMVVRSTAAKVIINLDTLGTGFPFG
jgi:hypothetical protein